MGVELKQLALSEPVANPHFLVYTWSRDGKNPVQDFILNLSNNDIDKFASRIQGIVQFGLPKNKERLRKLNGYENLYELIIRPYRYFFFIHGRKIILTEAYRKDQKKTNRNVINRAEERRWQYLKELGVL